MDNFRWPSEHIVNNFSFLIIIQFLSIYLLFRYFCTIMITKIIYTNIIIVKFKNTLTCFHSRCKINVEYHFSEICENEIWNHQRFIPLAFHRNVNFHSILNKYIKKINTLHTTYDPILTASNIKLVNILFTLQIIRYLS